NGYAASGGMSKSAKVVLASTAAELPFGLKGASAHAALRNQTRRTGLFTRFFKVHLKLLAPTNFRGRDPFSGARFAHCVAGSANLDPAFLAPICSIVYNVNEHIGPIQMGNVMAIHCSAPRGDDLIGYVRVSTSRQGRSGLGIEAQQDALVWFAKAEG